MLKQILQRKVDRKVLPAFIFVYILTGVVTMSVLTAVHEQPICPALVGIVCEKNFDWIVNLIVDKISTAGFWLEVLTWPYFLFGCTLYSESCLHHLIFPFGIPIYRFGV